MLAETSRCGLAQKPGQEDQMTTIDYIGFDIHKKTISFCAKVQDGTILEEGTIPALRNKLLAWAKARPRPWIGAMEATLFTGWIYDLLKPLAQELKVAHPPIAESHRGGQEEERQSRRAYDRGSAAVQSPAGVLHGASGDPRFAAGAALPQSGGARGDADEEPDRWSAHGNRDSVQQGTAAS